MPRTVSVDVEQVGPSTGQARARSHTVLVDRPVEKGGSDRGPLGGEYLLMSLGGCFLSTLLAAVRTRDADVSNVRVTVTGTIGGVPERFESMEVRVSAHYSDADLMRKLVALAERGCLVTNTLKDAVGLSFSLEPSAKP
jgi:putative redox protein